MPEMVGRSQAGESELHRGQARAGRTARRVSQSLSLVTLVPYFILYGVQCRVDNVGVWWWTRAAI